MDPIGFGSVPTLESYFAITTVIPVLLTLLVSVVVAVLFSVLVAAGVVLSGRALYTAAVVTAAYAAIESTRVARRSALRRRPGLLFPLRLAAELPDARRSGHKARNLAFVEQAGFRVPESWVLSSDAFARFLRANRLTLPERDDPAFAREVERAPVPAALLSAVEARVLASTATAVLLRSSFLDEDGADHAFPGLYDSLSWRPGDGRAALEVALKGVWASYWSERAVEYRRKAAVTPAPRLAVLICTRIEHELDGFAASAEPSTGYGERHIIDVATEGREWSGFHALLPDVVEPAPGVDPAAALPDPLVRRISDIAGTAEQAMGRPTEIEWGLVGDDLWIYQARPLTALKRVTTYTSSFVAEIPRYALSPLSLSFLLDDHTPARALGRSLERYGLGTLSDEDVRMEAGAIFLRWSRFKLLFAASDRRLPLRLLLGLLVAFARVLGARDRGLRIPAVPEPPGPGAALPELVHRLGALRRERLAPLAHRQSSAVQAASILEGLVKRIDSDGELPAPRVLTPLDEARRRVAEAGGELDPRRAIEPIWFLTEREAEIGSQRAIDAPEAYLERLGGLRPSAERPAAEAAGAPASLLVRLRDRMLTERERLNAELNAVTYEARLVAEAIAAKLPANGTSWTLDDVLQLTLGELRAIAGGALDPATLRDAVRERRAAHERNLGRPPVAILHTNAAGEVIEEPAPILPEGVLSIGIPLGGGSAVGAALFVRSGDWVAPQVARGRVLVLPDPSPVWSALAAEAAAVVFARGGPLSHLAIWCRERGIPTVVAARAVVKQVEPDQLVRVDGDRGEVCVAG